MKKNSILLLILIMSVLLISCNKSDKKKDSSHMDKDSFLESITLPELLSIDINLDEIVSVEEAKTFMAEHIEFDTQKLIDAFIKNENKEEKIWAEGPQIIAALPDSNTREVLSIYDGGKSFGIEHDMKGSFIYSETENDIFINKLNTIANISFDFPSVIGPMYTRNSQYTAYKNLDFLPFEQCLVEIKEIFDIAGMPTFDIAETYSLDLYTMLSQYELYMDSPFANEETKNINWTKEDESYLLSLRQLVDGIPIVNKSWQMPDGTKATAAGNPMPATAISLLYDQKGVSQISAFNILTVGEEIENNPIHNVFDALSIVIDDYSLVILEEDTRIISAELCYLAIPKDKSFELIPGWVFCSVTTEVIDGVQIDSYKYDAVNAVTGHLYPGRWQL